MIAAERVALAGETAAVARLRRYAESAAATSRSGDGWFAVVTGVQSNDMNAVVSVPGAVAVREAVDELLAWFSAEGVPASWIVTGADPELADVLADRGAKDEDSGWWSGCALDDDLLARVADADADVAVDRVASASDVDDWLVVAAACGWVDDGADRTARRDLMLALGGHGDLLQWVARRDGGPVALASLFVTGDVAGLCDLAVVEPARRQGIGRALAGLRLREARRRGASLAVASLSPDGWAMYRTLDFVSVPVIPGRWFYLPVV